MSQAIDEPGEPLAAGRIGVAIDIGSTVVKLARIDADGAIQSQQMTPRDHESGIAKQVESLLERCGIALDSEDVAVCSSANGGLRVGIVCLSKRFSGAAMRNQVLLAGANPAFVHDFDEEGESLRQVDILLVGGGIESDDAAPLERRLRGFKPERYRFGSLLYAGNSRLAGLIVDRYPGAAIAPNPLSDTLVDRNLSVFEFVRRAYLDDLVYKEGVSELRSNLRKGIRPTPEIVSRGFQRALANSSSIPITGACVVFDIGGATTDLHYTVEIVRDDSEQKPTAGLSVARFVFTDLGIVASRDSLMSELRNHPRLYEFLRVTAGDQVREIYASLREADYAPAPLMLAYGCLFIALDRFARGRGPGLPTADLARISQVILTGGASQQMSEPVVSALFGLFRPQDSGSPHILIDRRYELWVEGITWNGRAAL